MYRLVIVKVHLSVSQRFKACGVLMVMILDTSTLSILVYNLFLDRQRNISILHNISIHCNISIHHNISIHCYITIHHNISIHCYITIHHNISRHHNISIHLYIGCHHEIEIQIFKKFSYLFGGKRGFLVLLLAVRTSKTT